MTLLLRHDLEAGWGGFPGVVAVKFRDCFGWMVCGGQAALTATAEADPPALRKDDKIKSGGREG